MKFLALALLLVTAVVANEIVDYHFHTYYFLYNEQIKEEARSLRESVIAQVRNGNLGACLVGRFHNATIGPHPAGQWQLCCPQAFMPNAFKFYMQNRGNLSILLHPLTVNERKDHSVRAMWLGEQWPILLKSLPVQSAQTLNCLNS
ncbi:Dopa 4,5-dioxygenase [Halotydeus destructor]|nr:Dopa 4,5-dioxygenase [Halotydeus destructor]